MNLFFIIASRMKIFDINIIKKVIKAKENSGF